MVENQQSDFRFQDTTATKKIFGLKKRIRAVCGGTSASKTISILVWLIDYCQSHRNQLASVVSESYPHLEKGAMLDFENLMKDRGYWDDNRWHGTKHSYLFETGSRLEFYSPDTFGKAHGPRRDVLFVNEAQNLEWNVVDQLMVRTRKVVWLDWNPTASFWVYDELIGKRDDLDFLTLTYLDNEALDDVTRREIESHKNNANWWKVYGLGQLGEVEGKIYKDWQIIDSVPHEARLVRRGLDFGYSNDPTAIVDIYKFNEGYIIDEILFQKGMTNRQIADVLKEQPQNVMTMCDSAEPKSIDELKSYGINAVAAQKGPGSVLQGIQYVQDKRISVTRRSINVIKEYRNFMWMTDRDGKILNEPEHAFSHSMDAIRYGIPREFTLNQSQRDEMAFAKVMREKRRKAGEKSLRMA